MRSDYTLDVVGRVTGRSVDGAIIEQYGYDATDNITTARFAGSDESGAGQSARWQYRGTLLATDGRSRYTYDRAGRLIQTVTRRLGRKPDVWRYRWDAYDRLRTVITPDGETWTYGYDTAGRRTHKTNTDTGETTSFTWHGDQLVEQSTQRPGAGCGSSVAGTTTWSYLPGAPTPLAQIHTSAHDGDMSGSPGVEVVDVPLRIGPTPVDVSVGAGRADAQRHWSQPEIDREFYAIVTDHLGTPTHLIDPAAASVAGQAAVSLWGQSVWTGAVATPLRFPGQYLDQETGWHYNRYRYYQPGTGRYATPDPLGLAPAPNPHTYPANPTTHSDPLGLAPISACEARNTPGTASGGENLRPINEGERWLRGSEGNAGRIPGQIADALRGREFKNFDDFREQFWKEVSRHPELRNQFSTSNQSLMGGGRSPYVSPGQQFGGSQVYNLHHIDPIHNGGGVYDLDNIAVVTPRYHAEILDPSFHYNR